MYDIGIVGTLCDNDFVFAEAVFKNGLVPVVLRPTLNEAAADHENLAEWQGCIQERSSIRIYNYKNPKSFFRYARRCKLIVSFTLGIISALKYFYFLKFFPTFPPIINFTTGSDITELIGFKSVRAFLYRYHLKTSPINLCVCYPHAIKNILRYKIPNVDFLPYPFALVNTQKADERIGEEITFFHPSHLDWKISDPGSHRNSCKGNNRFLNAFFKAIRHGLNAKCVILDRGVDREHARNMIKLAGMDEYFIWKGHLTKDDLFHEYAKADVVVDQFDVGGPGAITIEAMSVGKPVMAYIQENCARLLYGNDLPPVLNCWSEEEIYEQIMRCTNRRFLKEKGEQSRKWVEQNHHWSTCLDRFLFYYSLLTGHVARDYGWSKTAYHD